MKITGLRTARVRLPLEAPIRTSIHHIDSIGCVLVWLDTDQGVAGEHYMWTLSAQRLDVLEAMAQSLSRHVVGRDPRDSEAIWSAMWRDVNFFGHKGITLFAIAALDGAVWDLKGKLMGQSVASLLGRARARVPTYASGGLWASMSIPELQAQAKRFVADGFRAVKMRLGKPSVSEDIERVAAVREAIGPKITLMADANQGFSVNHAIRVGRALEPYGLYWFEEPVQAYDLDGSARVAAEIDTPIASGETEYARYGFQQMIVKGAADVLMPDLERVGGISEYVKVAHMAEAFDVPVSPHLYTEYGLQLCGAIANTPFAEHMPWFGQLFKERLEMVEGELVVPDRPGLGFTFDDAAVKRLRVD